MADRTVKVKYAAEINDMLASIGRMEEAYRKATASAQQDSAKLAMSATEIRQKIALLGQEIEGLKDVNAIRQKQAEMRQYEEALDSVIGKTKEMPAATGGIFEGSFLGSLSGNIAAKGFDMLTGAITGVGAAMIGGNAEMEKYEIQFATLMGSTEAAKDRLADLAKFGAETPFELPEIAAAEKVLLGFGLTGQKVIDMTGKNASDFRTLVGDIAAGTGASFEEIALNMGKLSSGATGEAISRFQEMGIATREQLTAMGVEFSKSGELLSPLPVAMQAITQLTQEKFGGGMAALSSSFEGLTSTLSDTMSEIGRQIGKPFFDLFKAGLGGVIEFLGSPVVMGTITAIGAGLAAITGFMIENGDVALYLTGVIGALVAVMKLQAITAGISSAATAVLTGVKTAWGAITGAVTVAQVALNVALTANPIGLIVVAIGALIGGLVLAYNKITVFRAAVNAIWATMKAYFNFLFEMGKVVIDILVGVFTLDFERAGRAIARTGDVVVKGMTDMATAGAKAYNEEMEKGREENEENQKESLDRQSEEEEKAARDRAQKAAAAYMQEWGSQNVLKEIGEKQGQILAGVRTNFSRAGIEQARREFAELEAERKKIEATLDYIQGKVAKKPKVGPTFAEQLEADILKEGNALIADMDEMIGAGIDKATADLVEAEKAAFESSMRIREMRIDMIDNEASKLWEEYKLQVEIANREIENEEERLTKLEQLEKKFGKSISDARKKEAKDERDEYERSRKDFEENYIAPVAQASTDLILSLTDDKMTALEREQQFWNSMKNIALDVTGRILENLITQGLLALAELVGLTAAQAPIAAASGAMWAGPAALASTATFGGAAAAGAAGLTTTYTLAQIIGTPKFLEAGGIINKPTFVAGESGAEVVGSLSDLVSVFRAAVFGPQQRRTKITSERKPRMDVRIGVDSIGKGSRSAQIRQTAGRW